MASPTRQFLVEASYYEATSRLCTRRAAVAACGDADSDEPHYLYEQIYNEVIYDLLDPGKKKAGRASLDIKVWVQRFFSPTAIGTHSVRSPHLGRPPWGVSIQLRVVMFSRILSRYLVIAQEDRVRGVYISGLQHVVVGSAKMLNELMLQGSMIRTQVRVAAVRCGPVMELDVPLCCAV